MRRSETSDLIDLALLSNLREPWGSSWTPAGVTQVLEPLVNERRRSRIREIVDSRVGSVSVLMDAPHDPHNASAVLRSCDAFGVPELHVVPRDEPFVAGRAVAKGTQHWVDVVVHDRADEAVAALLARGFVLVATHPQGQLVPEDLASIARLALVLGNEHDGIRAELEQAASHSVRIPMRGFVESLNVSVAAALLLRAATQGRPGDLSQAERDRLYARGLINSLPRAMDILAASLAR
ncbi:MAG TPA: RNA methyltransferase [Polyangiaceae bacterium]|nr:RNA methyltransferase [Polyangiaceae bacterium]